MSSKPTNFVERRRAAIKAARPAGAYVYQPLEAAGSGKAGNSYVSAAPSRNKKPARRSGLRRTGDLGPMLLAALRIGRSMGHRNFH